jgi:hypothetical protein
LTTKPNPLAKNHTIIAKTNGFQHEVSRWVIETVIATGEDGNNTGAIAAAAIVTGCLVVAASYGLIKRQSCCNQSDSFKTDHHDEECPQVIASGSGSESSADQSNNEQLDKKYEVENNDIESLPPLLPPVDEESKEEYSISFDNNETAADAESENTTETQQQLQSEDRSKYCCIALCDNRVCLRHCSDTLSCIHTGTNPSKTMGRVFDKFKQFREKTPEEYYSDGRGTPYQDRENGYKVLKVLKAILPGIYMDAVKCGTAFHDIREVTKFAKGIVTSRVMNLPLEEKDRLMKRENAVAMCVYLGMDEKYATMRYKAVNSMLEELGVPGKMNAVESIYALIETLHLDNPFEDQVDEAARDAAEWLTFKKFKFQKGHLKEAMEQASAYLKEVGQDKCLKHCTTPAILKRIFDDKGVMKTRSNRKQFAMILVTDCTFSCTWLKPSAGL